MGRFGMVNKKFCSFSNKGLQRTKEDKKYRYNPRIRCNFPHHPWIICKRYSNGIHACNLRISVDSEQQQPLGGGRDTNILDYKLNFCKIISSNFSHDPCNGRMLEKNVEHVPQKYLGFLTV